MMLHHSANIAASIARRSPIITLGPCGTLALLCNVIVDAAPFSNTTALSPFSPQILGDSCGRKNSMIRFGLSILGARRRASPCYLASIRTGKGGCIGSVNALESRRWFGSSSLPVGRLPLDPKEVIPDTSGLYSVAAIAPREKKSQEEKRLQAQSKTAAMPLLTFDALREVRRTQRMLNFSDSKRSCCSAFSY
jgi:hypothetical protein